MESFAICLCLRYHVCDLFGLDLIQSQVLIGGIAIVVTHERHRRRLADVWLLPLNCRIFPYSALPLNPTNCSARVTAPTVAMAFVFNHGYNYKKKKKSRHTKSGPKKRLSSELGRQLAAIAAHTLEPNSNTLITSHTRTNLQRQAVYQVQFCFIIYLISQCQEK